MLICEFRTFLDVRTMGLKQSVLDAQKEAQKSMIQAQREMQEEMQGRMVERQTDQMRASQERMRRQMMAMQVAVTRERFWWFLGVLSTGCVAATGALHKGKAPPGALVPPLFLLSVVCNGRTCLHSTTTFLQFNLESQRNLHNSNG